MQRLQTGWSNIIDDITDYIVCILSMMTLSLEELFTEKNFRGSFTVVVMLKISKLNGWSTLLN